MSKQQRVVLLFGVPAAVGILNLTHPKITLPVYEGVINHLSWWLTLHILNLLLFPLLGLASYLVVRDLNGFAAAISRIALAIFIPIYAAFDALAGIGTGILVLNARRLGLANLSATGPLIDSYWTSGVVYAVAAVGSIAWVIAMLSAAVALTDSDRRRVVGILAIVIFFIGGWAHSNLFLNSPHIPWSWWLITISMALITFVVSKPRIPAALLILSGSLFGAAHVSPTGPLGMLCFLGAVGYLWSADKKPTDDQSFGVRMSLEFP